MSDVQFVEFRDTLLAGLNQFRADNNQFATNKAIQRISDVASTFPTMRAKEGMSSQILSDFQTHPLWEAAIMTIKSYVPWGDHDYHTHEQAVQMSRTLLSIAAQSFDWLKHERSGHVSHKIR